MERGCSLLNAPLFTLKFITVLKSRVDRKRHFSVKRVAVEEGTAPFNYGVISVRFKF